MAEGEAVKAEWPKILVARERPGNRPLIDATGLKPPRWKRIETQRYVPEDASHFTQLVEGLEAEIQGLHQRAVDHDLRTSNLADRLQALLDQHKKEGRS